MSYIFAEDLSTFKQVGWVGKKELVVATLDLADIIFVVHITSLTISNEVYSCYQVSMTSLKVDKALQLFSKNILTLWMFVLKNWYQSFQDICRSMIMLLIWFIVSSHLIHQFIG